MGFLAFFTEFQITSNLELSEKCFMYKLTVVREEWEPEVILCPFSSDRDIFLFHGIHINGIFSCILCVYILDMSSVLWIITITACKIDRVFF